MQTQQDTQQDSPKATPTLGTGPPVIRVDKLSLWYGSVIGVNNISVHIGQGVVGLLGPNGAGKSTLFKCITGQLQPNTGSVHIFDQPVWNNHSIFSRIGFVPEQDAFYETMTGLEFVTYLTRLQGFGPKQAREMAEHAMNVVSLSDKQDIPIKDYSKGMRQRTKIAQALAHNPDVLFLDEPLAGTDPLGRRAIIDLVIELGEQGKTILVSSHVLHEVEEMTSQIMLINKGRVLAEGDVYHIRDLIDEQPHTIRVGCDDPRSFGALLVQHEDVLQIRFDGSSDLELRTHKPDACYTRILKLAFEHDITITSIHSPDNNLMAVFNYLIK